MLETELGNNDGARSFSGLLAAAGVIEDETPARILFLGQDRLLAAGTLDYLFEFNLDAMGVLPGAFVKVLAESR